MEVEYDENGGKLLYTQDCCMQLKSMVRQKYQIWLNNAELFGI